MPSSRGADRRGKRRIVVGVVVAAGATVGIWLLALKLLSG